MAIEKEAIKAQPREMVVAQDCRFIDASLVGLAVAKAKSGSHSVVLSVFEDSMIPHFPRPGVVSLKTVRTGVVTVRLTPSVAKSLHDALCAAMEDLDSEQAVQDED